MAAAVAGDNSSRVQMCRHCNKTYSRPDHLKRHLQSHNNARTWRCSVCACAFNRKDLLDRHQAIHTRFDTSEGQRVARACNTCVAAKTKCWGGQPCQYCVQRQQECVFCDPANASQQQDISPNDHPPSALDFFLEQPGNGMVGIPEPSADIVINTSPSQDLCLSPNAFQSVSSPTWQEFNLRIDINAFQQEEASLFLTDSQFSLEPFGEQQTSPAQVEDTPDTIELESTAEDHAKRGGPVVSSSGSSSTAGSGYEAFQRTPIHYNPASSESLFLDEALNLAHVEAQVFNSPSTKEALRRLPLGPTNHCGAELRDAVLLLAQTHSASPIGVLSFPSAECLDVLLQQFLHQQMLSNCSFVHVPSFDTTKRRTELLSAMIASIASHSDNRQIAKMGLALQERVRVAVQKAFNRDGGLARALDMAQASILWIETGLWSGVGRMMEVAESAANNVPTMFRSSELYRRSRRSQAAPVSASDEGPLLRQKWLKWVELESYKRSVFRGFMTDVQSSVAYGRPPCYYINDVNLELPAARELWNASNATDWKRHYLSMTSNTTFQVPPIRLLEVLNDPTLLPSVATIYDLKLSTLIAVHGVWIQAASYLDSRALYRTMSAKAGRGRSVIPSLDAQRQDLYQKLQQFQSVASHLHILSPEISMAADFLCQALHASPTDIQAVAGRFGEDESRATLPFIQEWHVSEDHRYAIWHAGQVLRSAQKTEAGGLYGFYAMAVYHACLTLLISSVMTKMPQPMALDQSIFTRMIMLNGPKTSDVDDYLLTGLATPALDFRNSSVPISMPHVIPTIMQKTLEGSHVNGRELSPLMSKLLILVQDLSSLDQHELLPNGA